MYKKKFYPKKASTATTTNKKQHEKKTYLVIVESPSKCKKIEEYLGSEYACIASNGHLNCIKKLTSVQLKTDFAIKFDLIESKLSHIAEMRKIISCYESDKIYLGSDDDREGESISWHLLQIFGLPPTTKRIIFHEITQPALQYAIQHPQTVNMQMVYSQQARQVIDLLVGFKISPLLWKYVCSNKDNFLSAGRCQSVALRLIYENYLEGQNQTEEAVAYKTTGKFTERKIEFHYSQKMSDITQINTFYNNLHDTTKNRWNLRINPPEKYEISPPKPLTTSRLLQQMGYQFKTKEIMDLAQTLYQNGHITYMRTDCTKYSPVFLNLASQFIKRTFGEPYVNEEQLKNLETTGLNPHEAIRATHIEKEFLNEKDNRLNILYRFIWKTSIITCMTPAKMEKTELQMRTECQAGYFTSVLESPLFWGWQIMEKTSKNTTALDGGKLVETQQQVQSTLDYLRKLQPPFRCLSAETTAINERPHQHYNEAGLIHELENQYIGKSSTYSHIIGTLFDRGYVKCQNIAGQSRNVKSWEWNHADGNAPQITTVKQVVGNEKQKMVIQNVGIVTMEFLLQYFDELFSYDYTGKMESQLDDVSNLSPEELPTEWNKPCKSCLDNLKLWMEPLKKIAKKTYPLIDGIYEYVLQSFGSSLRHTLDSGEVEYKIIKHGLIIDLNKLEQGQYTADELLEFPNDTDVLGTWEDLPIKIKKGKFGWYLLWNGQNFPVNKELNIHRLTYQGAVSIIRIKQGLNEEMSQSVLNSGESDTTQNNLLDNKERKPPKLEKSTAGKILRVLDENRTIRSGKWGNYVHCLNGSDKPRFISLKTFRGNCLMCPLDELAGFT